MAKGKSKKSGVIMMVAKDENGKVMFAYPTRKSNGKKEKLSLKKYNPRTRKHETFNETKA